MRPLASFLLTLLSATPTLTTPLASSLTKREINPNTVNILTPDQLTTQRTALLLAQSEEAREAILFPNPPSAANDTFQFLNNTVLAPTGGTVYLSTVANFPALGATGLGAAVGFVNPCGLNTPHWHPRANEFLTVVQGTLLGVVLLESESGFGSVVGGEAVVKGPYTQVESTLANYTGMLFPKGLVHWQFNPECEPAVFVAGFDSPDPGRAEAARGFFSGEPDEVLRASLGYSEFMSPDQISGLRVGLTSDFTAIVESCAKKCGIPYLPPAETSSVLPTGGYPTASAGYPTSSGGY
ncbi:Cupin-1 domain-containing protein [Pyrenophora tritici-repentis]|uniref:Cupin n=2 Tax=Pyrenophora tritici-repentis TaxID=45151 RepID=A0A2W1D674_9PLEO|nr:spherulin 1a precursor [Pyrenophora tritici-repentis Pt-1C-BFP]KAA8620786.1 Cupin-1 domain-containing protein [Pyrenophora tritici-repentis]EDU43227.1 spherulin 1a precursor [Pyrenophora tritici-repentis Pt-1C-BFP]KAF7450032.1 Cupin 1 domain containing protein [Pyrenophora tritici-repentis]KAI0608322.1 Cupin-1 domain-containing protein [Pyrenophora tritici-repentis]KAI0620569.1 Cupin-1 domain-containing protein [Pyrenophora tritici-repentis]